MQVNLEVEKLGMEIVDLIKRNTNLEDKFNTISNFSVHVIHSVATMLYLM